MHILITGGSGFIGSALVADWQAQGHGVTVLTRDAKRVKNAHVQTLNHLHQIADDAVFDIVVNLAGASISQRWTKAYKQKLVNSRVQVTQSLNHLIKRLQQKPRLLISASAVGFYGSQGDTIITESSAPQPAFTHTLCQQWEQTACKAQAMGVPVSIIRLGVVLGLGHGILQETLPIFSKGLGSRLGTGQQYLSWVHITDVVNAVNFLIKKDADVQNVDAAIARVYNLTAPNPVTNNQWSQMLAVACKKSTWLPLPSVMVRLMFGEMGTALLLQGQNVLPEKLLKAGFEFTYPTLPEALRSLIDST